MTSGIERIYYNLPVVIQNIAVSLKGAMLERIRKGGVYKEEKEKITARSTWSKDQFANYQSDEFHSLFNYVINNVPFYKAWWEENSNYLSTHNNYIDIKSLPITSKEKLKKNVDDYISIELNTSQEVRTQTTGTTGTPLDIISDKTSRQKNYAHYDAYLESLGINPAKKRITIGGRIVVSPENKNPPFWRYSFFQKALLMSSYHLNEENIGIYVKKIKSFNPEYIESYPSSLFTIASYMLKKNIRVHCKTIVTSAETLFPEQREIIEEAFSTKIFDHYGCAEMCVFVAQCKAGQYHVHSDYGVLEILNEANAPVETGTQGRVVCTGFINRAMTFIRYPIGDLATYSDIINCECGLNTPILKEIAGRADDVLYTKDGRVIGRMSPVLKGLPVRESQFIQYNAGELDVLIVPEKKYSNTTDTKRVIKAVQLRMGKDCKVSVQLVDNIPRGSGGKFKSVISKIK